MNHWTHLLFAVVFLGQIFVSSWFLPRMILRRADRLHEEYPPERYPKLYPGSAASHDVGRTLFLWSSRTVFVLGFALLYCALVVDGGSFAKDGYISEVWPAVYGMIQFMPLVAIELLGFRHFRQMREANTATTRKADLRPRRLFAYVSPALVTLALALMVAVIGFDLYAHDFHLSWSSDAAQQAVVMVLSNVALAVVGLWQLYGRKLNPYQASKDRARQTRAQLTSLLLLSCALSVFMLWQTAGDVFNLHFLDAPAMSLYFQIIVALSIGIVMYSLRFEDIDFNVYSNDSSTEKNHG